MNSSLEAARSYAVILREPKDIVNVMRKLDYESSEILIKIEEII